MEEFKKFSKEDLSQGLWKASDFPEVVGFPSKWLLNKSNWFGYYKDNKLIGVFHLKFKKDYLYLHILEIKKNYHNKGFGKAIINYIRNMALRMRYNIIRVNPRDYRCYGFYEKCGFTQIFDKNWQLDLEKEIDEKI